MWIKIENQDWINLGLAEMVYVYEGDEEGMCVFADIGEEIHLISSHAINEEAIDAMDTLMNCAIADSR